MPQGAQVDASRLAGTGAVLDSATSADGARLATCSADGAVCTWHRADEQQPWQETARWSWNAARPTSVSSPRNQQPCVQGAAAGTRLPDPVPCTGGRPKGLQNLSVLRAAVGRLVPPRARPPAGAGGRGRLHQRLGGVL